LSSYLHCGVPSIEVDIYLIDKGAFQLEPAKGLEAKRKRRKVES
jgi:hypothetical protein